MYAALSFVLSQWNIHIFFKIDSKCRLFMIRRHNFLTFHMFKVGLLWKPACLSVLESQSNSSVTNWYGDSFWDTPNFTPSVVWVNTVPTSRIAWHSACLLPVYSYSYVVTFVSNTKLKVLRWHSCLYLSSLYNQLLIRQSLNIDVSPSMFFFKTDQFFFLLIQFTVDGWKLKPRSPKSCPFFMCM